MDQFAVINRCSFGGCIINGNKYELDYDNCKTEAGEDGETAYFPDLVKVAQKKKKVKKQSNEYIKEIEEYKKLKRDGLQES